MIWNLGSINADYFYHVPHIPHPGQTLAASDFRKGLGGKGANQSVAMARAGAKVAHIGAIGADGAWMRTRLTELGVGTDTIATVEVPSGHAVICVADDGENAITLLAGANGQIPEGHITAALRDVQRGDWLVLQNETNGQHTAAALARDKGGKIAYSAAPFDAQAAMQMLPLIDLLAVNAGEAEALTAALGLSSPHQIPVPLVLVTMGAAGGTLYDTHAGAEWHYDGIAVTAVDTTGAGDTFFGYFIAGLAQGMARAQALTRANHAAALKVTRHGTAEAIPTEREVLLFGHAADLAGQWRAGA